MFAIRVDIIEWVDDAQPGVVACQLIDAWGREHRFIEKVPIATSTDLDRNSTYPQPGWLDCELVRQWQDADGRALATITTERPRYIASTDEITHFDVLSAQVHTIDDTSGR